MRHGKKFNHLGRKSAHRKAMLNNMACSLIMHKRIITTLAKAKELRKFVEPLVTKARLDTMHSRRIIFSYLEDKEAIKELFATVVPAIGDRPGGYTRILKIGNRAGDNAEMAFIEFVDFNELAPAGGVGKKRRRRRASSTAKKTQDAAPKGAMVAEVEEISAPAAQVVEEAVVMDDPQVAEETSGEDSNEEKA